MYSVRGEWQRARPLVFLPVRPLPLLWKPAVEQDKPSVSADEALPTLGTVRSYSPGLDT